MARKKTQRQSLPSDDEVDEFHSNREQILFDDAGEYAKNQQDSDSDEEEVMAVDEPVSESQSEADSDADSDAEEEDDDEEHVETWGGRKNYYGGDEAEDAEAAKLMAEEALRQQKKHLQELGMDDYVDEDMMEDWSKQAESFDAQTHKSVLVSSAMDLDKLDKSEKMELLAESFPEFVPLVKEMSVLKPVLELFGDDAVSKIKKVALSSYLGAIASYLSLFASQVHSGDFESMKEHPVMEMILATRQVWKQSSLLEAEDEFIDAEDFESASEGEEGAAEVQAYSNESDSVSASDSNDDSESDASDSDESVDIDLSKKREIKRASRAKVDDFTEAQALEDVDAEDKQRRKKSLRFYTSKIDQSQAKNPEKFTGDLDLPYKERLFERKQRLLEEARQRGLGKGSDGADLDGEEFDSADEQAVNDVNDDYYEDLKKHKESRTADRKLAHKQAVQLAREGKLAEAQELADATGKRALNFQIMKNKGLTAKKRKEIRNSRVKKRKKYDQAKKKLKSVRQVYESNKGPYEGEKTGIKKGLSRSVKLV